MYVFKVLYYRCMLEMYERVRRRLRNVLLMARRFVFPVETMCSVTVLHGTD